MVPYMLHFLCQGLGLHQNSPFTTQPYNKHVLRHINEIISRSNPVYVTDSPNLTYYTRFKVILVARPLLMQVARKLCRCEHCIHEQTARPFSNNTSHRNRFLLFVKHLAKRILTRKYQMRQQYTDRYQHLGT
jgi:hypothetical protein